MQGAQLFERLPVWVLHEARTLREAALGYAGVGMPVFPVQPQGKAPLVARGLYAASTNPNVIDTWWRRWPQANIGMPMGKPSGCWALDIDPRHGGLTSLEHLAPLPPTRVQQTGGGGMHFLYRACTDLAGELSNAVGFAGFPGLDLRVDGGYIVVPPSQHSSGGSYRWQNDLPLEDFPAQLVEQWRTHRQHACPRSSSPPHAKSTGSFCSSAAWNSEHETDPEYWLRCALKYGIPGQRHNYALFLACRLLDSVGLTPGEAEAYLVTYATQVPQDGDHAFSISEVLKCLEWAAARGTARRSG